MWHPPPVPLLALLALLVALTACGGGGTRSADPSSNLPAVGGRGSAGGGLGSGGLTAPSTDIVRYYPQRIVDPMAGNVTALTFLVPEGWAYQGNVQWLPDFERAAFLQTTVSDPATGLTIDYLPIQDFIWFEAPAGLSAPIGGNYQGKVYLPPITDPVQFVAQFWATALPQLQGLQPVSVESVPAIANEFATGFGGPADAAAYRLRYAYQRDGAAWEEEVHLALLFSGSPDLMRWYVNFAYTIRAPQGLIDQARGITSTVIASRDSTPEWEATVRQVQKLFTQGIQQQMADTQAFGQKLAEYRAEIQALQAQVTAERAASQDRIAELRRETLGGVETYDDPVNGGSVQLPVGWNEYWVNEKGEYLTSEQAGFDPNTLNDGTWQRLQVRNR